MNVTTTRPTMQSFTNSAAFVGQKATFGPDLDPFSGLKRAVSDTFEFGGEVVKGALPGYGAINHASIAIGGGVSGRSNFSSRVALGGAVVNAAGTLGLAFAAGQFFLGGDPTLALGLSAGALGTSGLISAFN